jgi:hypothetical protein
VTLGHTKSGRTINGFSHRYCVVVSFRGRRRARNEKSRPYGVRILGYTYVIHARGHELLRAMWTFAGPLLMEKCVCDNTYA